MQSITKQDINFLKALGHEMATQDKVCQAAPRFWVVRGTIRQYGIQDGWSNGTSLRVDCETMIDDMKEAYEYLLAYHSKTPYKHNEDGTIDYYNSDDEEWVKLSDLEEVCEFLQDHGEDEAELIGYREVEKIYENTMFLTNKECKAHIKTNYYHYPEDAHPYAMTAWRAPQVEKLWNILEQTNWDALEKLL